MNVGDGEAGIQGRCFQMTKKSVEIFGDTIGSFVSHGVIFCGDYRSRWSFCFADVLSRVVGSSRALLCLPWSAAIKLRRIHAVDWLRLQVTWSVVHTAACGKWRPTIEASSESRSWKRGNGFRVSPPIVITIVDRF